MNAAEQVLLWVSDQVAPQPVVIAKRLCSVVAETEDGFLVRREPHDQAIVQWLVVIENLQT